jgi:hypothetical protein
MAEKKDFEPKLAYFFFSSGFSVVPGIDVDFGALKRMLQKMLATK